MDSIDIKKDIAFLYGDRVDEIEQKISDLLMKYGKQIHSEPYQLSEKDVVLITYADTLTRPDEKPLQTLHAFLEENLKGLVNSVHLLPFFPYTSDDGFSVQDYYQVNPDFGSWENIEDLSQEYRLMFDAVVNHVSKGSEWFQEFLKENPKFADYFIEADPDDERLKSVFRPRALPLVHNYTTPKGKVKSVWTTFSEDQVDLNYSSANVFLAIMDLLLFYVSKGARLIRLDAVGFLWKRLGTTCIHLPETHRIIQVYRKVIEALAPDVIIITETNVPHKDNISYFGNGHNEAHMVYNFSLPPLLAYSVISGNVEPLTQWLSQLEIPDGNACYFNFTASHDGIGLQPVKGILKDEDLNIFDDQVKKNGGYVSFKNNPDGSKAPYELNCTYINLVSDPKDALSLKARKFLLTQAVMLSLPGVPGIYIHSLLGTENDRKLAEDSGIPRRINRSHLDYSRLMDQLNSEKILQGIIFNEYKNLLRIRIHETFFNPFVGFDVQLFTPNVFAIHKTIDAKEFWAVFNFSAASQSVSIESEKPVWDMIGSRNIDQKELKLEPYGFRWLKTRER